MSQHKFNHTFHASGVNYVEMNEVKLLLDGLKQRNAMLEEEGKRLCRSIYNNCYYKGDDEQLYCESQIRQFLKLCK